MTEGSADTQLWWFDAHLDLAYLDVNRRDMTLPLDELDAATSEPHPPASVTLAELERASVRRVLGTVFTEPGGSGPEGYEPGDAEAAARVGREQMAVYERWSRNGHIDLATYGRFAEPGTPGEPPLALGVLIENADPVREPDELIWWHQHGVLAVGLAWALDSRYACGNATTDDTGLTDLGEHMVGAIDALHIVHDLSHLSPRSVDAVLDLAGGAVIASHSNCRALLGGDDVPHAARHLGDNTIKAIAERNGVIGLNLFGPFVAGGLGDGERPTIEQAVAHVEHVCSITGSTRHVGLGSDLDGGFSAERLPAGIDRASDFVALTDALRDRGWSNEDLARFAWGNWSRVFAGMASRRLG